MIVQGDCVALMAELPEGSVDAIVTDPPYGLEFMGKEWDSLGGRQRPYAPRENGHSNTGILPMYGRGGTSEQRDKFKRNANREAQEWHEAWAREALRILKPGGHLLAFGGTRTYHRLACAIEDAGFEIRDCLAWLYGSGFPKSLDVSKAIDKAACAEREVIGARVRRGDKRAYVTEGESMFAGDETGQTTAPATPEAEQWQGWGTALKPAHEPIVLARKPLAGTVAQNVLGHGTGALNVDGCRIGTDEQWQGDGRAYDGANGFGPGDEDGWQGNWTKRSESHSNGRWPANVLLDEQAAAMLDEQTGESKSQEFGGRGGKTFHGQEYDAAAAPKPCYGDSGGASRFLYVAKSSSAERNAGLDGFEEQPAGVKNGSGRGYSERDPYREIRARNTHPTVKPIELMRWLVRLVTPPGGTVLDPFTGSGTTGCAAALEGFNFIGMEREAEYVKIAEARIQWWSQHPDGLEIVKALEADRERRKIADSGQLGLLS